MNDFWEQQEVMSGEAFVYLQEHGFTVMMAVCKKVAHSTLSGNK